MESDYNTFEVMWQYWREKKKTNGYEYGGRRVGNCSNHKKYKEMSIKFKNVPISDKKKKKKNGFNLFFFKKFLYIIAIDGVKKKPYLSSKMSPHPPTPPSSLVTHSTASRVKWMITATCPNLNACRLDALSNHLNTCNQRWSNLSCYF